MCPAFTNTSQCEINTFAGFQFVQHVIGNKLHTVKKKAIISCFIAIELTLYIKNKLLEALFVLLFTLISLSYTVS